MRARVTSTILLALLLAPAVASARLADDFTYRRSQLWGASVRLIAVDYRYRITERDADLGFVLFEYPDRNGRVFHGSLELVELPDIDGERARVRVVVRVNGQPSYVERMILDRLVRKLGQDYGPPPPLRLPRPAAPPAEEADEDEEPAGEDEGEETPASEEG
jgi:hypothetical protein